MLQEPASTKVDNKPTGFSRRLSWVSRQQKLDLPLSYGMESAGVYHEALAWQLCQLDKEVRILLPNEARHYLQSLGEVAGAMKAYITVQKRLLLMVYPVA